MDGGGGVGSGGGLFAGSGFGGAIFNLFGSVTLTNSTLTDNAARGGGTGGAIFNLDSALVITHSTIAGNTVAAGVGDSGNADADGGAVHNLAFSNHPGTGGAQTVTLTLRNSILADSTAGADLVNRAVNGANTNTATADVGGTTVATIFGTADPQPGPRNERDLVVTPGPVTRTGDPVVFPFQWLRPPTRIRPGWHKQARNAAILGRRFRFSGNGARLRPRSTSFRAGRFSQTRFLHTTPSGLNLATGVLVERQKNSLPVHYTNGARSVGNEFGLMDVGIVASGGFG